MGHHIPKFFARYSCTSCCTGRHDKSIFILPELRASPYQKFNFLAPTIFNRFRTKWRTYLSTLSHKRLSEKKKITMVKPFARSSGMDILKYSRLPRATPSRWARRGPIRRILFNYLNRLRKKLISALIYFISFFSLLPTRSPRNRCDRAPLTSPSGSVSVWSPLHRACTFLVGCCVKSSSGCRLRPRSDLFS